jgi:hypothetical protein
MPHAGTYVCALSNIGCHESISDPHSCMDVLLVQPKARLTLDHDAEPDRHADDHGID